MESLFMHSPGEFHVSPYKEEKLELPDADIKIYHGFFSQEKSDYYFDRLLSTVSWRQDKIKFYGKIHDLPRLTAWYGETDKPYKYSGIEMNPLPWTELLEEMRERIEVLADVKFSSVLLNRYRNGSDSVNWHSDDEKELGLNPVIASVSLGETRKFQLKHKYQKDLKSEILVTHGSLIIMKGTTQHYWQHQIPKSSRPLKDRINLTFRVIG